MSGKPNEERRNILDLIDQNCAGFRSDWKNGGRPRIEEFLAKLPPDSHTHLFQKLLLIELRYRHRASEHPSSSEYHKRFPIFRDVIGDAFYESAVVSIDDAESEQTVEPTMAFDGAAVQSLGNYKLTGELGRSAFGIVYEAKHQTRGNRVALKLLPSAESGDSVTNLTKRLSRPSLISNNGRTRMKSFPSIKVKSTLDATR